MKIAYDTNRLIFSRKMSRHYANEFTNRIEFGLTMFARGAEKYNHWWDSIMKHFGGYGGHSEGPRKHLHEDLEPNHRAIVETGTELTLSCKSVVRNLA